MPDQTTAQSTPRGDETAANRRGDHVPVDTTHAAGVEMSLPTLDDGITLLDIDGSGSVPLVQSLVLDRLLMHDGPAFWVDAEGHATTTTLARITPSRRLLRRIQVARGFTAYQHYAAVCDLQPAVRRHRQAGPSSMGQTSGSAGEREGPSLIVAPAVDARYRCDDTLTETHAATLQARTLARLSAYAEEYQTPVLVTRTECDEFTAAIEAVADHQLACEQTQMGPRITGEGFEPHTYPVGDSTYRQTTLAYWQQLLAARATQASPQPASETPLQQSGLAMDDSTATVTDPLLDAWTAENGGQ